MRDIKVLHFVLAILLPKIYNENEKKNLVKKSPKTTHCPDTC